MQQISELTTQIERIDRARKARRRERIARHGWAEAVSCAECGDTGWVPGWRDRPCRCCERGRVETERRERERAWEARCPRRMRGYTLDGHPNGSAAAVVRGWLEQEARGGTNLVLTGHVGTGKTGLATGALREAALAGWSVRSGTVADVLDGLRPRPERDAGEVAMAALQRTGLLLLDDLGVEKSSEWQAERLYMIVNGRYERGLPTIVTTNRTQAELVARVGERVMSRLMDRVRVVALTGADRRGVEREVVTA
jgi:DNA replication protein DnaC